MHNKLKATHGKTAKKPSAKKSRKMGKNPLTMNQITHVRPDLPITQKVKR